MKHFRKKFVFILCLLLCAALLAGCTEPSGPNTGDGGNGEDTPEEVYEEYNYTPAHNSANRFVYFESSDAGIDDFLNSYNDRHMRDNPDTAVGAQKIGYSTRAAWREWDSLIGGWWDASAANGTMTEQGATNDKVNEWLKLENASSSEVPYRSMIDNQGYVWGEYNSSLSTSWGMGWEFPDYTDGGQGWGFSARAEGNDWTLGSTSAYSAAVSGSRYRITTSQPVTEISMTTTEFDVPARYTPFLRIGFTFTGTGSYTIDDLYVQWQTSDSQTWSDDKTVAFSSFSTRGFAIGSGNVTLQDYAFPMYLNENWGADFDSDRRITALRIVLRGETQFEGELSVDYVVSEYDDRQPLNNCNYILAAKNNLEFSRDKELLQTVLPNARRAMNFMLYTLGGSSGLISTEYLVGHFNEGMHETGTGIGNGYWDVDAFPTVNLYCNVSFYNALVAMKYLEDMAVSMGIPFESVTTVNAQMDGADTYSQQTADGLSQLIELCKQRIQTEFWNEETGRFHAGEYDTYGGVQDHGYVMFNEQVLAAGIATEAQEESVLSWINGERIVDGDDSTGSDIWYYEFAPRFNTQDIGNDFYWLYSCGWNGNVQNGGTALHLTYYDMLAQSRESADSAYESLKKIQTWYEKVSLAGGIGDQFYRAYYSTTSIPLQGGGTAGLVGVDFEFLEAALLMRAIPDVFFGMSTTAEGSLCFAPNMASEMDWWRIENLVYSGWYYDVSVGKYFLQITAAEEYGEGTGAAANLTVTFNEPGFDYTVCIDGAATQNYTVQNGKITVTVPFGNVKVEIRG